jgi:hypothetical protein
MGIDMNADGVESGTDAAADAPDDDEGGADGSPPRSHRRGMLAGPGVVGLLLAGLLFFGPGGAKSRPTAQRQATRSPVTIFVRADPATATTTTAPVAAPRPPGVVGGVTPRRTSSPRP